MCRAVRTGGKRRTALVGAPGRVYAASMDGDIEQINARMLQLGGELSGLRGAVLRESAPQLYQAKLDALAEVTRAYFRFYFDGANMPMP